MCEVYDKFFLTPQKKLPSKSPALLALRKFYVSGILNYQQALIYFFKTTVTEVMSIYFYADVLVSDVFLEGTFKEFFEEDSFKFPSVVLAPRYRVSFIETSIIPGKFLLKNNFTKSVILRNVKK